MVRLLVLFAQFEKSGDLSSQCDSWLRGSFLMIDFHTNKWEGVGRDVYGNRDIQAYEKGRQDINKIRKAFDNLPRTVQDFYLQRLAAEFQHKCFS